MSDENKPAEFKWVKPHDPIPEIYTNYVHATWTLFDVRVRLGQLVPQGGPMGNAEFVVEERASVTFAWPEAKVMRDLLNAIVDSYEKTNGEIKPLKLAPIPSLNTPTEKQ